ncbi:resuscitation-promoting factor [Jiangella ureilytica]|uniref:Resuscitation-promoting factor n=1 Tax=Jiangella ureilytica TaxID=2530374 RepID=A0A4R4RDV4_9ACTN|nr:resuscitation-promoting factor [Jiangella ureilytica]TDC47488.1 resuscitation-promoting factor [Jiangella ureilytica]
MRLSAKTMAINATVVTALVGGGVAYITLDNAVALSVDGQTEAVHTFGDTVEDVLDDRGIELSARDEVIPSLDSDVEDGTEISVRYARQVTVTVDGEEQQIWTTALSVDEALRDLNIRAEGADLSVARSQPIGRGGIDFEVRTPKEITLVADGASNPVTTTALTVREALDDAGVTLGDLDLVEPALEAALADAATVTVRRVTVETETVTAALPFEVTEQEDDSLAKGTESVETEGKEGSVERVMQNTYIDGELSSQEVLSETVVAAPVDQLVLIGTKEPPPPADEPSDSGGSGGGDDVDGGVWDRLAQCESGGNWSINTGNGYYGGLQFSLGTWRAFGGSGYPHENSKAEQIRIAEKVRDNRGGYGDWPACARSLGLPLG